MSFCGNRTSILGTSADMGRMLPVVPNIGGDNLLGCNDPRLSMVPEGTCSMLYDPSNMKICSGDPHSFLPYEECNAPASVTANPLTDYCQPPSDLTYQNQDTTYGLNCESKRPLPSCQGVSQYLRDNNLQSGATFADGSQYKKWADWDSENNTFSTYLDPNRGTETDKDKQDQNRQAYAVRRQEVKNLCNQSYSLGVDGGTHAAYNTELSGENPWEYCEWSDVFNSCSTGGSSTTGRSTCYRADTGR